MITAFDRLSENIVKVVAYGLNRESDMVITVDSNRMWRVVEECSPPLLPRCVKKDEEEER